MRGLDCENITWSNIWPCTALKNALYIRQEIWCTNLKATNNYLQSDLSFLISPTGPPKDLEVPKSRSQRRGFPLPSVESTLKRGGNDGCDGSPVQSGSKDGLPGRCHWESNFVWKGKGKEGGNGWGWFLMSWFMMIMVFNVMVMTYMYIYIFLERYKKRRDIEIFSRRRHDVGFSLWKAIPCARRKSGGFHEMRWSGDPFDENEEQQYAAW